MSSIQVNIELVKKYNQPGPRYTSYPPATQFSEQVDPDELLENFRQRKQESGDLSLYLHLPFCRSLCWYCGCNTIITTRQKQSRIYLDYLKKELALRKNWIGSRRRLVQFHLGGGTPTFLQPEEIRALGDWVGSEFDMDPDVEAGVEIDPRRLSYDHVAALREIGCNRASIGVQDTNPKVQQAVHRVQPREQTDQAIQWVRRLGYRSLNLDLMYGLPYQTVESFERTLEETLAWRPDRLAVFSYAHVPWLKPAQRALKDSILPNAELKLELLKLTIEKLTASGYVYIGMDHFAREEDELAVAQKQKSLQRNFQGYSTHGHADIHALGLSAISQAGGIYWQNQKDLAEYYGRLDRGCLPFAKGYRLTEDDRLRRYTIMRLMCDLKLDYDAMSQSLGVDFADYFAPELAGFEDLETDGLVERNGEGFEVTEMGRLFIRNIAMRFDAYLPQLKEKRFSKTI